jgi:hypothetical protein
VEWFVGGAPGRLIRTDLLGIVTKRLIDFPDFLSVASLEGLSVSLTNENGDFSPCCTTQAGQR